MLYVIIALALFFISLVLVFVHVPEDFPVFLLYVFGSPVSGVIVVSGYLPVHPPICLKERRVPKYFHFISLHLCFCCHSQQIMMLNAGLTCMKQKQSYSSGAPALSAVLTVH